LYNYQHHLNTLDGCSVSWLRNQSVTRRAKHEIVMEQLKLKFLGSPEASYQRQSLKFRSRKELALLIYLVVTGQAHSREKLIAFLWPNSDRKRGQASLRNALARLRQTLGGAESYLIIEPSLVSFDIDRSLQLDLDTIQTALKTIQETAKSAIVPDLSPLQTAVTIYSGEFLEGFSLVDAPEFDDWVSLQREVWHQHLERIFNRLSRLQFEANQIDQALDTTRQWVAHDPLHEAAYRRLMQLHFLNGNRTAALQTYEQCSRNLAKELRVGPEPETMALAERIRREDLRLDGSGLNRQPKIVNRKLLALPFVGRTDEHSRLVAMYQTASQGQPQVVCLLGEAGIGKTRLIHQFLTWAATQEADILQGRTFEAGGQLPYQPLVDALRERLEQENAPDDLLPDVWLSELSQLLPEIRERYPDLPLPSAGLPSTNEPNLARSRLFEAVAQLGQVLAKRKPIVIFIDDLQWADAATLEILPYLCRRWAESQSHLLLLLTLRSENLITTPRLREWLAQLEREVSLTRLHLPSLTIEEIQQLVTTLSDPATDDPQIVQQFSGWLFAETTGQPFFMTETVKMLAEQNILPAAYQPDGHWVVDFGVALRRITGPQQLPLPPNVREVILTRLGHLSETARAMLAAGAVLGRVCSFEHLCQISGVDELEGLAVLDELVKSQLLLETAPLPRPYTFAHDKIQDVIYTEIGDARRRIYHRRAFESLQAEIAPAAELAHHALAARLLEQAFHYSVAAGDEAASVYAHTEAINAYRRALDLAKRDQTEGRPEGSSVYVQNGQKLFEFGEGETNGALSELYLHLGRTFELASQYEEALVTYQEMERLAQEQGDRSMYLAALMAQITPLVTVTAVFNPTQGEALLQRALPLAQALGDQAAEAKILWNQLILYRNSNKLSQAIACGERALILTRQIGPSVSSGQELREQMAFILHDLGYGFAFMADFKPAKATFQEAVTLWRELNNLPMLADSLVGACLVEIFTGEYDTAITCFEQALQINQTINNVWGLAGCRHNIGFVYGERGQMAEAIAVMEEGIRLSEAVGFISPLIIVRADLATLYGTLGAFDRGLEMARLALNVAETKMPLFRLYALAALIRLYVWQNRLPEAEAVLEQMKQDPHQHGWEIFPPMALQVESELALAQGSYEQATALAEEAIMILNQLGMRSFLPSTLYGQGQAWLNMGQSNLARERWLAAHALAEAMGSRRTGWQILFALSQLESNPTEAKFLRQQAQEAAQYIADHTPPDLRVSFLALPTVRVMFD
jgi:DNA-binding SARP family transcriptional activator